MTTFAIRSLGGELSRLSEICKLRARFERTARYGFFTSTVMGAAPRWGIRPPFGAGFPRLEASIRWLRSHLGEGRDKKGHLFFGRTINGFEP